MNAIQDITKTATTGAAAGSAANADIGDRFLKLLVAQMRNQDPLNPLDNAQVTSQLAQINTVNGIEKLNASIGDLSASLLAGQSLQSAGLIGRTVFADGNRLALVAGAPARGALQLNDAADSVKVTVSGAAGNVVRQIELGPRGAGLTAFEWDGRNDAGAAMAPGAYSFQVAATRGGQNIAASTLATGVVSGVIPGSSGARVSVDGIGELTMQQIRNIR